MEVVFLFDQGRNGTVEERQVVESKGPKLQEVKKINEEEEDLE